MTWPPAAPTTLQNLVEAYVYQQYNDDPDVPSFFVAYNEIAQAYLDWFNETPLPVYTSDAISGSLLDWVARGLYGMTRPVFPSGSNRIVGPFNTEAFNAIVFNKLSLSGSSSFTVTNDDIFKRVITWWFFKGDGFQFSIPWFKRRIMRFLIGANGQNGPANSGIDNTYPVSVTFSGTTVDVAIKNGTSSYPAYPVLASGLESGILQVPFQFSFSVSSN